MRHAISASGKSAVAQQLRMRPLKMLGHRARSALGMRDAKQARDDFSDDALGGAMKSMLGPMLQAQGCDGMCGSRAGRVRDRPSPSEPRLV